MTKIISISLSPNTERDDVSLALRLLFSPWRWIKGGEDKKLERSFRNYFGFRNSFSFNSGRSCLIAILHSMGIGRGDEVIVQGFTCNAAVNPIVSVGATPVYADIGENLNISPEEVKKKITDKTKAIIVQHTFGYPADIAEIMKICKEHNLYLIEDCAHALGAKYRGEYCGSFGDASFFSFGRDKVISSVYGGMAIANRPDLAENLSRFQAELSYPTMQWTGQQLLHPILMNYLVLPFYQYKWGRGILAFLINSHILSRAVASSENKGKLPPYFPERLPSALSALASHQLAKLERLNRHRKELASFYPRLLNMGSGFIPAFKPADDREPIFLKYPVFSSNSSRLLRRLSRKHIYLNDGWRETAIVPPKTVLEKVCYANGDCPRAEAAAKKIISLPTHIGISRNDARRIVDTIVDCS